MDQFGYVQAAQAMLPTPGQPGAQQMPFQKASTQMCRQAIEVLRQLANQYKTEGQMAEEGQITAMVARLIKLCERKSKEESQVAEALLGGM